MCVTHSSLVLNLNMLLRSMPLQFEHAVGVLLCLFTGVTLAQEAIVRSMGRIVISRKQALDMFVVRLIMSNKELSLRLDSASLALQYPVNTRS